MLFRLVGALLLVSAPVLTQPAPPQQVPQIPFDSAPNPLQLPPGLYFGEVSGVAVNSK